MNEEQFFKSFGAMIYFYERSIASIEVVRGKHIYKVDFIVNPYLTKIEKPVKNRFNDNVDRSSLRSKVTALLQEAPKLIGQAKNNYNIEQNMSKICIVGPFFKHA